jgi:hypothetical protein
VRPAKTTPSASNDNAWEPPVVRAPAARPGATYARSGNLFLPLRFARQLPEWARERPELRPLERIWRSRAARTARVFNRLFSK